MKVSSQRLRASSSSFLTWTKHDGFILLAYIFIALITTYPLIFKLGGNWLPYDSDDLWLKLWDIWYVRQTITAGGPIHWTNLLFYPLGLNLALHSINWVNAILAQPAAALFGISTAYNLSILGGIITSAYSAYLLINHRVTHKSAAFFGGLIYAAGPYTIAHAWSHPDHTRMWAIPLCILLIVLALQQKSYWAAGGAGIAYGLAAWSSLYLFGFLSLTLAPVVLFYLLSDKRWRDRRIWMILGFMILVSAITVGSRFYPVLRSDFSYAVESKYRPDQQTDLLSYFVPTANPIFRPATERLFPGFSEQIRWSPYLGLISLAMVVFAFFGRHRQSERWLWLVVLLIFLLFTAGDTLRFDGRIYDHIYLPARLLQGIGLFRAVRPNLYHTGLLLPFSMLAAFGLDSLLERLSDRRCWQIGMAGLLSALTLTGYWIGPTPMQHIDSSPFLLELGSDSEPFAVIDIPMDYFTAKVNLYRQTLHQHPTAGGFAGRLPPGADRYIEDNLLLHRLVRAEPLVCGEIDSAELEAAVDQLVADGFRYVLIHNPGENWPLTYFSTIPTTYADDSLVAYDLRLLVDNPLCAAGIHPLPEEESAPLFTIPSPDGFPCGVFDVRGQGEKDIDLTRFPGCLQATDEQYTVRCLNGEGQWISDNIFDLTQEDEILHFTSGQHGQCAIFTPPTE